MADHDRPDADETGTGPGATVIQLERPEANTSAEPPAEAEAETRPTAAGSVVVDQRMRQRRIAVLRAAGQRRLWRIVWLLVPVALLVDGAAIAQTSFLDVDRILVEATEHTTPAGLASAAGIDPGDALVTLDEHRAERAVEQLPWVDHADVVREWPGTVRITVTERVPAAVVSRPGDAPPALVDREGRVLDVGGPVPFGVISVTDVDTTFREGSALPASAMAALDLGVTLNERLPGAAVAVDVDLDATLNQGGIARFGNLDELENKLVALEAFLADVDLSGLAVLDLRVPDNPTVRRT